MATVEPHRPRDRTEAVTAEAAPPEPVNLRFADGSRRRELLDCDTHARLLDELLHADRPGFVEIVGVSRLRDGTLGRFDRSRHENFVTAGESERTLARIHALAAGERREVFLTPPTLSVPLAGNESVAESSVAWVDVDDPHQISVLREFPRRPHAVVASGSGGCHAYWLLAEAVGGDGCEEINRKLAATLGADPASCNRGRILRIPGSLNWKHSQEGEAGSWCQLLMCDFARAPYDPDYLTAGLTDPKAPPAPVTAPRDMKRPFDVPEPWTEMEAAEYYRVITGLGPGRDGMVRCPSASHEDKHPSAHLYPGVGKGWYCFACGARGSAVDMVAAIRGLPTGNALRGDDFNSCILELRRLFGIGQAQSAEGSG